METFYTKQYLNFNSDVTWGWCCQNSLFFPPSLPWHLLHWCRREAIQTALGAFSASADLVWQKPKHLCGSAEAPSTAICGFVSGLRVRAPGRRGRCGCGRVQMAPTGWAVLGRGSGNHSRRCVQNERRRWAAVGRRAEGRLWLGRWARGWTNPLWGCPCWPRSLSSKSLPLRRCSPSHCSGCERERGWFAWISQANAMNHAAWYICS